MSEQSPHTSDPTTVTIVAPATIEQFEHESHELGEMYQTLFETNPNLALYLRRRAAEVSPDLTDREIQSKLALEIVTLVARQQGVNGLEHMFALELLEGPSEEPYSPPAA